MRRPASGLGLRGKLLLVAVTLLALPWVGVQYVREMEAYLRGALEDTVRVSAQAVAGSLISSAALFTRPAPGHGQEIYVHELPIAPQMDGYGKDWAPLEALTDTTEHDSDGMEPVRFIFGRHGGYLYGFIQIRDDSVILPSPYAVGIAGGDHVEILVDDTEGIQRRYLINTLSPGAATVYEIPYSGYQDGISYRELRIRAFWQTTATGFNLELRLPRNLLGGHLGLVVDDVDDSGSREVTGWQATVADRDHPRPGPMVAPSAQIRAIVESLGPVTGRRITVVDPQGTVRATLGTLKRRFNAERINPLYRFILGRPRGDLFSSFAPTTRMRDQSVGEALAGRADLRWRRTADDDVSVVSAAIPIRAENAIIGAVVVEESTLAIQSANRQALLSLFNKTLLAAAAGGLALLLFATRISWRLRRLRDQTEQAIDEHGRVVAEIQPSTAGDEIGDLSRGFAAMATRLKAYNHYLEQLARRLSHELRTPLTIVRSSLDNLDMEAISQESRQFTRRARSGLERLERIIVRMGESARLEQAMRDAELSIVDLGELVSQAVAGYATAWPEQVFTRSVPEIPVRVRASPDLFLQMLDKIVANAREFSAAGRPVEIRLERSGEQAELSVVNYGASLPEDGAVQLFDSMVSLRERPSPDEPHLGLGLFIARMVCEFHNARIYASNLAKEPGVKLRVQFPLAR